ncbi:MAG: HPr family phosphocarrier protein [Methylophilaceae bacterium]
MIKTKIKIINKLGLHARASSKLTELANKFKCDIRIKKDNEEIDPKNMMDILMLAASYQDEVELITNGIDEVIASKEIENLFLDYFGEGQ